MFLRALPLYLAPLVLAAVVVAFLLRRKTRRRVEPSLTLWEEALGRSFARSRSLKLRDRLAFVVALLTALSLLLAWAEPTSESSRNAATIVVFDNSASVAARERDGKSRFDKEIDALEKIIANKSDASELALVTTAGVPTVVSGFTRDQGALKALVASLEPVDATSATSESLRLARFLRDSRGENASIVVLTDAAFREREAFTDAVRAEPSIRVALVGEPRDNVALLSFAARRSPTGDASYEVSFEVANFGNESVAFDVELGLDETLVDLVPLELAPDERAERVLTYESLAGGKLSCRLLVDDDERDALTLDDELFCELPDFPETTFLVLGSPDRRVLAAFAAQPNVATKLIAEVPDALGPNEVLVVFGELPERPPRGKIVYLNPTSDSPLLTVGPELEGDASVTQVVESPLLAFLDLSGVKFRGVRESTFDPRAEFLVVASSDGVPVVAEGTSPEFPDSRFWIYNFSLDDDSLARRVAFPILFANLTGALRGGDDASYSPDRRRDEAELDLRASPRDELDARLVDSRRSLKFAFWKLFAYLALALATAEYCAVCRGKL